MAEKKIKCVVVGDGAVGKTCMLESYCKGYFPKEYVPTVFDNFTQECVVDGEDINLSLWDTAGQEEYGRLRLLSYPETDVVIICFNIGHKISFRNISAQWLTEVKEHCINKPILLVGTKKDMRDEDTSNTCVLEADGKKFAEDQKLYKYMECSALTDPQGLPAIFEEACRAAVAPVAEKQTSSCCTIF